MLERGDDEAIIGYVAQAGFLALASTLKEIQVEARAEQELLPKNRLDTFSHDPVARAVAFGLLDQLVLIQALHQELPAVTMQLARQAGLPVTRLRGEDVGVPPLPERMMKLQHALMVELGVRRGG